MAENSAVLCGVCAHEFDGNERPPMLLTCGHTFCLECIKRLERYSGAIICPNCRGADYRLVSQLKKNIQLVPLIDREHQQPSLPCPAHPLIEATLYCLDCSIGFCSKCIAEHKRHDLYSVTDSVITNNTSERVDAARKRIQQELEAAYAAAKKCQSITASMETAKTEVKRSVSSFFEPVLQALRVKQEELTESQWRKFTPLLHQIKTTTESVTDVLRKRQKVSDVANEITHKLQRTAGSERLKFAAQLEQLTSEGELEDLGELEGKVKELNVGKLEVDLNAVLRAIVDIPVEAGEAGEVSPVSLNQQPQASGPQCELALRLKEAHDLSPRIFEVLASTDRKDFMPGESTPYEDRPQKIGFNTTISAPHMHAMTLRILEEHLRPGAKVLDVGCGSGYLTVCMGKMIGSGKVFGIDHIEELINQASDNVLKSHFSVFASKEVELRFITADGRDGLPEEGPFDVIHIGASTPDVPPKLLEQLAIGGRLMLPLGPINSFQQITIFDKVASGALTRRGLMNVNYAPLVDRARQCP